MPSWIAEHFLKTIIGVLITALLGGVGYVALASMKVPDLEAKLAKHDEQLAAIRVSLVTLMTQSMKPLDKGQIEKLLSSLKDLGDAKAALLQQARLESGSGELPLHDWVPPTLSSEIRFVSIPSSPVWSKEEIARIITASAVTERPTYWTVQGRNLRLGDHKGSIIFIPSKKLSPQELEDWALEMNVIKAKLSSLGSSLGAHDEISLAPSPGNSTP